MCSQNYLDLKNKTIKLEKSISDQKISVEFGNRKKEPRKRTMRKKSLLQKDTKGNNTNISKEEPSSEGRGRRCKDL